MSSEIKFRQKIRNRKKKQIAKQKIYIAIFSLIIILILSLCVKSFFSQKSNKKDPDFIFNGYVYPMPPEKNSDILLDLPVGDDKKTAYLTFDDGPNTTVTPKVLDVLRRYNIKATFFVVGTLIEANPQVARRIYDEGHFLANHSYSHNYTELYADSGAFMNQINKTQELIDDITGRQDYKKVIRFPGGGYNTGTYGEKKQEYKEQLIKEGYRYCDWNSLTGDAESSSPSVTSIISRLKASSKDKEDVVVLMHDALSKSVTAKTLPDVIEYFISQGYEFDTLDNI